MSLIWQNLAQVVLCMGLAILIFAFLQKPLTELLNRLIGLPAATAFYTRVLGLVVLLIALRRCVQLIDKADDAWGATFRVMENVEDVMEPLFVSLLVFLGLITVLVAVLRRGHEQ
ncbi:MAG TPA: hypothetical protein VN577_02850 [Terriglobales bacterium]|nr:hypothetical protein [Terriglobales bacterium]